MSALQQAAQAGRQLSRLMFALCAILVVARVLATHAVDGYWGMPVAGAAADAAAAVVAAAAYGLLRPVLGAGSLAVPAAFALLASASLLRTAPASAWAAAASLPAAAALLAVWWLAAGRHAAAGGRAARAVNAAALAAGLLGYAASFAQAVDWRTGSLLALLPTDARETAAAQAPQAAAADAFEPDADALFARARAAAGGQEERASVLLIVVDGLGPDNAAAMPQLAALAAEGIVPREFAAQADKRADALYMTLCGDYASESYVQLKPYAWLELDEQSRPACLAQILLERGWQTSFVQAGERHPFLADKLLPAAGFDSIAFAPDDDAAAARAAAAIAALAGKDAPWLLLVHLAGSPQDAEGAAQLDAAIAGIADAAGKAAPNLLTAIASGASHAGDQLHTRAGFAALRGAQAAAGEAAGLFGSMDVAVSVLDALGLATAGGELLGVSMLDASGAEQRQMLIGPFWASGAGAAFHCKIDSCELLSAQPGTVLGKDRTSAVADEQSTMQLRAAMNAGVQHSLNVHGIARARALLFKVEDEPMRGNNAVVRAWLVRVPAGRQIALSIEIANEGEDPGHITWGFQHDLLSQLNPASAAPLGSLGAGMTRKLAFSFPNGLPEQDWKLAFQVHAVRADARDLRFALRSASAHALGAAEAEAQVAACPLLPGANAAELAEIFGSSRVGADGAVSCVQHADGWGPSPLYRMGTDVDMTAQGAWNSKMYLARDWTFPEDWGVWSAGKHPSLQFDLGAIDAAQPHDLLLRIIPYVRPDHLIHTQDIGIEINGTQIAQRTFDKVGIQEYAATVPPGVLRPGAANVIKLTVGTPYSEYKYGRSDIYEWLGVALLGFRLAAQP